MPNVVGFDLNPIATVKRATILNEEPLVATWKKKLKVNRRQVKLIQISNLNRKTEKKNNCNFNYKDLVIKIKID